MSSTLTYDLRLEQFPSIETERVTVKGKFGHTFSNRDLFQRLSSKWKSKSPFSSSIAQIASDPSYRQIILLGRSMVPMIIEDLRKEPDHWFVALAEITGLNPIKAEHRGNVSAMAQDWIEWWDHLDQ